MAYTSEDIANLIRVATHITRGRLQNTRLTFRKPTTYAINLVNHLGEVIETSHTYKNDIDIEILCDGDLYRAMSNPRTTMAEWFNNIKDKTAAELFDMSMTQTITSVEWNMFDDRMNISIWFNDSIDNQTNIDAEVIEAILNIIDLKKEWWRMTLNRVGWETEEIRREREVIYA